MSSNSLVPFDHGDLSAQNMRRVRVIQQMGIDRGLKQEAAEVSTKPTISKRTTTEVIGAQRFTFTSDVIDGEPLMDTEVRVNDGYLCTVAGQEKEQFIAGMRALIEKYSI